jgi:hypothetical protein
LGSGSPRATIRPSVAKPSAVGSTTATVEPARGSTSTAEQPLISTLVGLPSKARAAALSTSFQLRAIDVCERKVQDRHAIEPVGVPVREYARLQLVGDGLVARDGAEAVAGRREHAAAQLHDAESGRTR